MFGRNSTRIINQTTEQIVHATTELVEGNTAAAESRRRSAQTDDLIRANDAEHYRWEAEQKAKTLQKELDECTRLKRHLQPIAMEIAIDRRALLNAFDHLAQSGQSFDADALNARRCVERAQMEQDAAFRQDVWDQLDQAAQARNR